MRLMGRRIVAFALTTSILVAGLVLSSGGVAMADQSRAFNNEYIFAATRGVNDMEGVHPGLKATLFPVTILLDTAFLPFAVVAGLVT